MHLEIQYDHELCNDLLAVTAPEKITPHRSVFSGTSTRLGKISRLVAPCKYSKPLGDSAGSARSSDQKQSRSTGFSLHSRLSGVGFTYFQKAPRPSYASRGPMKTGRICHPPAPPLHLSTTESTLPADYGAFKAINNDSGADSDHCADNPADTITMTSSTAPLTNAPECLLQSFPPTRPPKTHHLRRAAADLTMRQFFFISYLAEDDEHTLATMQKHSIYHWSVFKGMTKANLVEAGFNLGPARLIVSGTAAAVAQLENL
ncbi:hypothetical protein PtB15_10B192 [Puccinia triticina]|nr:hypothetical protein PtB15_10B192 [Puccinia triticina]